MAQYNLTGLELDIPDFMHRLTGIRQECTRHKEWYVIVADVNGKRLHLKGFNTWVQILRINGGEYGGNMDIKVSEFNLFVRTILEREAK